MNRSSSKVFNPFSEKQRKLQEDLYLSHTKGGRQDLLQKGKKAAAESRVETEPAPSAPPSKLTAKPVENEGDKDKIQLLSSSRSMSLKDLNTPSQVNLNGHIGLGTGASRSFQDKIFTKKKPEDSKDEVKRTNEEIWQEIGQISLCAVLKPPEEVEPEEAADQEPVPLSPSKSSETVEFEPEVEGEQISFQDLIRNQKYDLICKKLQDFWKLTVAGRQKASRLFVEIFTSIVQNYFIDHFANLEDEQQDAILNGINEDGAR